jgi:hypothetical protein
MHPPGFTGVSEPVRLSLDHLWGAWLTDRDGNPHTPGSDLGVTVQKPGDPDSRFTMPLPVTGQAGVLNWTTPTTLVVQLFTDDAGPVVATCEITTRTCVDTSRQ